MILNLFSRRRQASNRKASLPAGTRVYAIGDIHGRLDLLQSLLAKIEADDRARPPAASQLILLGDLIDRGPASAQVVEMLLHLAESRPDIRFLKGNHEEVFLKALTGDLKALAFFTRIGGRETILSYGVTGTEYLEADYSDLLAMLDARVPATHIAFLQQFEDLITVGDYAFVHAGVRPGRSLADQEPSDLRWIRGEFLNHRGSHEKVVVHGHTVVDEVEDLPHRIGLDTGAYASGRLTAMGFEADQRWLIQTIA